MTIENNYRLQKLTCFPNDIRIIKLSQCLSMLPLNNLNRFSNKEKTECAISKIIVIKNNSKEAALQRSSQEKDVLKLCSKFTGEYPCRSKVSIKLHCNFIEITLRHRCSPVNLLHIFRVSFLKNTSEGPLLTVKYLIQEIK